MNDDFRNELPTMLSAFDFADPDFVTGRRNETNVPAQALLLLNDETFLRAAEAFAKRSEDREDRIAWMFRAATGRRPDAEELLLLDGLRRRHDSWTLVAHTILNLDEVIARR